MQTTDLSSPRIVAGISKRTPVYVRLASSLSQQEGVIQSVRKRACPLSLFYLPYRR